MWLDFNYLLTIGGIYITVIEIFKAFICLLLEGCRGAFDKKKTNVTLSCLDERSVS